MTVPSETYLQEFAGNGVTIIFPIGFQFAANSDIRVAKRAASGDVTQLSSGFTIAGAGTDNRTCTMGTAPLTGETLVIGLKPLLLQQVDYISNDRFPAETHEAALDNGVRISQRLFEESQRALRFPFGDSGAATAQLPIASQRASKFLTFDASGNLTLTTTVGTTVLSQAVIGDLLYPQHTTETGLGITAVNKHYPYGFVYRYGTNTTPGTTDLTAAYGNALKVAVAMGVPCQLPGEHIVVSDQPADVVGQVTMQGYGQFKSRIIFRPIAHNKTPFKAANGASRVERLLLRDFSIWSDDTTFTKIGLDLYDLSVCAIKNVLIWGSGGAGPSAGACWSGANSIGIRTHGREATSVEDLEIVADRPIVIAANPNTAANDGEDMDHWNWRNCYLIANGNPIIEVDAGLGIMETSFDGYQAWVGGTKGFKINDTRAAPTVISRGIRFSGVRHEQITDAAGYVFDMTFTVPVQNIELDGVLMAAGGHGITINGFERLLLRRVTAAMGAGKNSIVTAGVVAKSVLTMQNCIWQAGSNVTLTGLTRILAAAFRSADYAGPSDAVYAGQIVDTDLVVALLKAVGVNATAVLDVSGTTGDRFQLIPQAAGSGVSLRSLNNAASDFEPMALTFETLDERYRTGAGTSATARDIDTAGQTRFYKRLFPATDAGASQTVCGIHAGNGVPNNANGSNGDFYFRGDGTQAGNTLIYHKEAGTWVALVST